MEERMVFEVQNEVGIDPFVLITLEPEALKPMSMKWLRTKIVMATYASSPVKVWPYFALKAAFQPHYAARGIQPTEMFDRQTYSAIVFLK